MKGDIGQGRAVQIRKKVPLSALHSRLQTAGGPDRQPLIMGIRMCTTQISSILSQPHDVATLAIMAETACQLRKKTP